MSPRQQELGRRSGLPQCARAMARIAVKVVTSPRKTRSAKRVYYNCAALSLRRRISIIQRIAQQATDLLQRVTTIRQEASLPSALLGVLRQLTGELAAPDLP